ncbi:NAD(P)-binding protein [Desulfosarcina cetonica]|uniref:NAD(P)-binding protein n=1 Tax=Desulfosarcina cetonica TaxID=90730 RepID=UPI00155D954C|nr:NAD(P)-binding protein [Desulfosarcina cetonica]
MAGSGLSSLTVAWDLARKGYAVTVIEPGGTVGGNLVRRYPQRLTDAIVAAELDHLSRIGVRFETNGSVDPDGLMQADAAVYIGLDAVPADAVGLDRTDLGMFRFAGDTGREGLFAGGSIPRRSGRRPRAAGVPPPWIAGCRRSPWTPAGRRRGPSRPGFSPTWRRDCPACGGHGRSVDRLHRG